MAESFAALQGGALAEILKANPGFDPASFDFHDAAAVERLDFGSVPRDAALATLKAHRRIVAVSPDLATADTLLSQGWSSAHDIAALPRSVFVAQAGKRGIAPEVASEVHARATSVKAAAQHLFFAIKDQVADRHFPNSRVSTSSAALVEQAQSIPSYQDLFGTLNYYRCPHCQSILGPAAYFLDMMRIAQDYITAPNTTKPGDNIPDSWLLRTRRPDLFELKLDCDNSDTPVPYLEVVNRILERHIAGAVEADPWQTVASAPYPFNLPFNLSLTVMRDTLDGLRTSLAEIYAALAAGDAEALAATQYAVAREYIGLTIEQAAIVSTPATTPEALGPFYGYDAMTPERIAELSHVQLFLARTGLTRDQLLALLYQQTSPAERPSVAPGFFINATGEAGVPPFMAIVLDETDPDKVFERIDGLTLKRLDRISRFVRLAAPLGWSFADLDWAMASFGAIEIAPCIEPLAAAQRLVNQTGLSIDQLAGFWYLVKNIGTGADTRQRIDLFDRTFNNPALLGGKDPYAPGSTTPFDPAAPETWTVHGTSSTDTVIRARLGAALLISDDALTLAAEYLLSFTVGDTIETNLANLSALYRLAGSARAAGITMGEYVVLARLAGLPAVPGITDALAQMDLIRWLGAAGLNAYELSYIVTGEGYGFVDPGYREADIRSLIESLSIISAGARLGPSSFVFDEIDAAASEAVFDYLRGKALPGSTAYITDIGILKALPVTFPVIAPAQPVHEADLVSDLISATAAATAFAQLIDADIIVAAAGATDGPIAESFGASTSLDFLFVGEPLAQEKRDQVREVLDSNHSNVEHSVSVVASALTLQNQNAQEGLAQFLGTSVELMRVLIPFSAGRADLREYLEALLTPLPPEVPVPSAVPTLISYLARSLYLINAFQITAVEAQAMIGEPEWFGITGTSGKPTIGDVHALWTFKRLTAAFRDTTNRLLRYFAMPSATPAEKEAKLAALASLAGWPPAQVTVLADRFWPSGAGYSTVQGVARMKAVFDIAAQSGLNTSSLLQLNQFATLGITASGTIDPAAWQMYEDGADMTLDALAAKYPEPDQADILKSLREKLIEQKRDALLGYAIFQINKTVPSITVPADLFPYLLIDVEMTSCDSISYIAQGHAALQLYMQRCRLNLELGVTDLPIPESWWSWIGGYRLWEANRKVFLYPENYIEPTLRRGAPPEFYGLSDELLQNDVTKDKVEAAYRTYMDDFAALANLRIASSYRAKVPDAVTGALVDTLFLFGRTNTDPNVYYWRKCEFLTVVVDSQSGKASTKARWDPWRKLDITIPAQWVTPVYAFGKLMLFWVETEKTTNSIINSQQQSENHTAWTAQIRYSFLNFSGEWVQPQLYAKNAIINFNPDDYINGSTYGSFFNVNALYWNKVSAIHVPPNRYAGTPPFSNTEQLLVFFGAAPGYRPGVPLPPLEQPTVSQFPEQDQLNWELYQFSQRINAVAQIIGVPAGVVPIKTSMAVDAGLAQQAGYVALLNGYPNLPDVPIYSGKIASGSLLATSLSGMFNVNFLWDSYTPPEAALAPASGSADNGDLQLLVNVAPANTAIITVKNQPSWYVFDNGDDVFLTSWQAQTLQTIEETLVLSNALDGLPAATTAAYNRPYTSVPVPPLADAKFAFTRLGTHAVAKLSQTLFMGGIDALLSTASQEARELPFSRFYADPNTPPAAVINTTTDRIDFDGAYGPYYWDIFFHAVFLVAETLRRNHRNEEAKSWYEYIFNPTQPPVVGDGTDQRYWRFLQFRHENWESLADILTNVGQIAVYNDDPFDPHAIARLRPSAYPKSVVMRYIDNLIDWADRLFALDTRESITQATNLYLLASDLLGPKPVDMGIIDPPVALSYDEIAAAYDTSGTAQAGTANSITLATSASTKDNYYNGLTIRLTGGAGSGQSRTIISYDGARRVAVVAAWTTVPDTTTTYQMSGIPQFLIELEVSPIVGQAAVAAGGFGEAPFNAIDAYFCVPENDEFVAYWAKIEDRLYKIRHCLDIHGVVRQLALYAPPLDVRALVRAAATGNLVSPVSSQTAQPVPVYRFAAMIEKAKALASNVMGLGGAMLSAIQQGDAEALALLRTTQERVLLDMTTRIRTDQIAMLAAQREALLQGRAAATARSAYYKQLIAVGLSPGERANLDAMARALVFNILASVTKTAASIGYAVPQAGSPFAMTYGGKQIGAVLNAASGVFEIGAAAANFAADRSITMAGYDRRAADWQLQADLADRDVAEADFQLAALDIQTQIAQQELAVHQKTIAQNAETEAFLKRKFTNQELFQWLAGRLSTVYFQTYSLALDLSLGAQRAYQYENNTNETFINFSYWENLHRGLMAGEGLMLGLNQMEASAVSKSNRGLEIERTISLLQLDPKALLDLRETGRCSFELGERLFDQDYPGHYARKIKTISISLPAVIGPYQNIKATLTQTSNRTALTPDPATVRYLLGVDQGPAPGPDKLRSDWRVNQQIALSSGVDDSGLFVLDFQDPRYLPFEGTGAVSTWELSMPKAANRIDFDAISDVVIQLRYTAANGGERLRSQVVGLAPVKTYSGTSFYPLAQQFSSRWFDFMQDHSHPAAQVLTIPLTAPIAPPQVDVGAVLSVALHLQVRDDAAAEGDYLAIQFPGDSQPTPIVIGPGNSGTLTKRLTQWSGDWKLSFALGAGGAPSSITDGTWLDPAKLLNVGMVLYYDGTLDWD